MVLYVVGLIAANLALVSHETASTAHETKAEVPRAA